MEQYSSVTLGSVARLKELKAEFTVEELEARAIRNPAMREEIVSQLGSYVFRYRTNEKGRAAKKAIRKISVITMLEMLHDEPE